MQFYGTLFQLAAFVVFLASAVNIKSPKINLIALGLAFWVLSSILLRTYIPPVTFGH
jgi:hypothetical protein